jgi:hypothetical protein
VVLIIALKPLPPVAELIIVVGSVAHCGCFIRHHLSTAGTVRAGARDEKADVGESRTLLRRPPLPAPVPAPSSGGLTTLSRLAQGPERYRRPGPASRPLPPRMRTDNVLTDLHHCHMRIASMPRAPPRNYTVVLDRLLLNACLPELLGSASRRFLVKGDSLHVHTRKQRVRC